MEPLERYLINLHPECFENAQVISFVGAGGKTTSMFTLASEFRKAGETVLVTTSTAIYKPEKEPFDCLWLEAEAKRPLEEKNPVNGITVWGDRVTEEQKLKGLLPERLQNIIYKKRYNRVLIEADGSREKPMKASNETEPVMVASTDLVIGVLGMSALGLNISEANIHRSALFCELTGKQAGQRICEKSVAELIAHPQGLFQYTPKEAKRLLLLNQADDDRRRQQAAEIAALLRKKHEKRRIDYMLATSFDPANYELIWSEGL